MIATLTPPPKLTKLLYRYIADNRSVDSPSTKQFRKKMWGLTLEIISSDGAYCQCKGSDGNYYQWIPVDQLEPVQNEEVL